MSVLNYTTQIAAAKTVGEVQTLLAGHGASRIAVDYDGGAPVGVTFALTTAHGPRLFTLPVDVDAMHRLLTAEVKAGRLRGGKSRAVMLSREQAERVAWRVVKDWLAAQLALVQTEMAAMDQVMLPYLHADQSGRTLYAAYRDRENVLALEAGR
ncbi:hypothetical protein F9L07_28475 [Pimelobacter simplex]|uniref:Uncharacterized protein n=1 Tax=Nocardioides simplex TaxID=2045 RepID=A0A7J5DQM9_NOCSI|nr:hypothetical protein [Pimelobacter simplex]KAB2806971.1 hypothetical protein F9L07_28475 [Pimelobacter simplex]